MLYSIPTIPRSMNFQLQLKAEAFKDVTVTDPILVIISKELNSQKTCGGDL